MGDAKPRVGRDRSAWQSLGVKQVRQIGIVVAVGVGLGLLAPLVFTMLVVAVSLLVALVTRVAAQERTKSVGALPKLALGLAMGSLAGQLISWFGIIGGLAALVLLFVVFVAAGGDLL